MGHDGNARIISDSIKSIPVSDRHARRANVGESEKTRVSSKDNADIQRQAAYKGYTDNLGQKIQISKPGDIINPDLSVPAEGLNPEFQLQ